MELVQRKVDHNLVMKFVDANFHEALAQVLSSRNIKNIDEVDYQIEKLLNPLDLKDCDDAANFLADAIEQKRKIMIIGDYDADGATGTSIALLGFKLLGLKVNFLIPSRFKLGYGLSPEIVDLAKQQNAEILITVDNGVASFEGVKRSNELGMDVIITDHHLQAENLPEAKYIINPNQRDCKFESKNLCGAGVIFYLLIAIRKCLRNRNFFVKDNGFNKEPNLMSLIDLVALGTVADLVQLDFNNRLIVYYGLKKIRSDDCNLGIKKLFHLAKKDHHLCQSEDLSFLIAPKINAAGRMSDMSLGVKCLVAENESDAHFFANQLIHFNVKRKIAEDDMKGEAAIQLEDFNKNKFTICLYNQRWHQGVVGILASRIKEKFYRPVIIFADDVDGKIKGSARSISNLHIRDALDHVSKIAPELILSFGGHAMAAGLSIMKASFDQFQNLFEKVVSDLLTIKDLDESIEYDKSILNNNLNFNDIKLINQSVWGNGFSKPIFVDEFECMDQTILKDKHSKLMLLHKDRVYEAIFFNFNEPLFGKIKCLYSIDDNTFMDKEYISLNIRRLVNE